MKKITLLFLLTFTISYCQSQEEIDFKVGYLPNFKYTLSQIQFSESTVKYIASDEIIEFLKKKGIANPTFKQDTNKLKRITKTGKLEGNGFPVSIELLESTEALLIKGARYYGKSIYGITKIDSFSVADMPENLPDEKITTLLKAMETTINQIKYPERKIKVGESFEMKTSMKSPNANLTIETEIKSIYTLKKVNDGIGYFDLESVYRLKSKSKDSEVNLDGTGNGKIEYDIEKNFITKSYSESEIETKSGSESFSIEMKVNRITEQKTEIVKTSNTITAQGISRNNDSILLKNQIAEFVCGNQILDADGNIYHTILIGTQCWMQENLATTKYNDAADIPLVTGKKEWRKLTTPGFCFYNNSLVADAIYGGLYNWYAVNTGNLCPTGWHIPTDDEWKTLEMHLGMTQAQANTTDADLRGTNEGGKLKETGSTHWGSPNVGASNSSGFTALAGGVRSTNFIGLNAFGYWWSATEYSSKSVWQRYIFFSNARIHRSYAKKMVGFSVRCVRD